MIKDIIEKNLSSNINKKTLLDSVDTVSFQHNFLNHNNEDKNSNPFEKREKIENNIQKYFNNAYIPIDYKIKNIEDRLNLKNIKTEDNIAVFLNDSVIESSLIVAKYFYDNSLKINNNDKKIYFISKENGIYTINIKDENKKQIIEFNNSSILKMNEYQGKQIKTIDFYNQNIFEKLFSLNKNTVKKYTLANDSGEKIEELYFTKNKKPEKYVKYALNKKEYEIIFDTSEWQKLSNSKIKKVIPQEYIEYGENESLTTKLNFQYAKPYKYIEFNSNTGKITKIFNLQGLSSLVSKYSFYNSLTGQMLAFGTL